MAGPDAGHATSVTAPTHSKRTGANTGSSPPTSPPMRRCDQRRGCRSADGLAGSTGRRWGRRQAPSSGAIRRPQEVFPSDPVFALSSQPSFAYREASIAVDTRNHRWPSDDRRALSSRVGRLHRSGSGRVQLPSIRSGGGSLHPRLAFASGVRDARLAGGIPHRRRGMGARSTSSRASAVITRSGASASTDSTTAICCSSIWRRGSRSSTISMPPSSPMRATSRRRSPT